MACGAAQPTVCDEHKEDLREREAAELRSIEDSGLCDSHDDIATCAEWQSVKRRWDRIWATWGECGG